MTDYNDGKWHTWAKAEKPPLHDLTRIERVFINSHGVPMNDYDIGSTPSVGATSWSGNGVVLAFRVTKEHKEPREFWLGYNWVTYRTKKDAEDSYGTPSGRVIHVREVLE